jgi:hypothetical protein
MFDAQTLLSDGNPVIAFSPWMPRGGDNLRCLVDVLAIVDTGGGTGTLTVDLFHKNADDEGDGTANGSAITMTTTGRNPIKEWTAIKELVRFRFTFDTSMGTGWVTFRVLPPSWFDTATTA